MEYGIAKQLKDAGFPQKHLNLCEICVGMGHTCLINETEFKKGPYEPSLKELIEACDAEFALKKAIFPSGAKYYVEWEEEPLEEIYIHGETAEEAVAKLWLELNRK